jgi:hypothetical protein
VATRLRAKTGVRRVAYGLCQSNGFTSGDR